MGIVFKFVSRVFYVNRKKEKLSERIKRKPAGKARYEKRKKIGSRFF